MLPTQVLKQRGFSLAFCLITTMLLSGCGWFWHGKSSIVLATPCPEVDVIDSSGIMHWLCRKTANGVGGYRCANGYDGVSGCENHPTWKCTTVGQGANQNCYCQP
jgi:hypothetical protein